MGLTLGCFFLPVLVRQFTGLSPYLGLVLGLGIVWAGMDHLHHRAYPPSSQGAPGDGTALQRDILSLIRQVDHRSLLFLVGVLLIVSALQANGVLGHFSDWLLGDTPSGSRMVVSAVLLGYASAVVDNVPLTALAISVLTTTNSWYWTLLAYTVGTGGSHLVLGSVAGVIATGKIPALTTATYVRIAFVPVFVAYLAGLAVWLVQYGLFG
jgi:Na+/H+ antiporter NhaD/arsenite permease-like protein